MIFCLLMFFRTVCWLCFTVKFEIFKKDESAFFRFLLSLTFFNCLLAMFLRINERCEDTKNFTKIFFLKLDHALLAVFVV